MKGTFREKVQIAEAFRSAYHVLDKLCQQEVDSLTFVYHRDFHVTAELLGEYQDAAREAIAYKEALSFGRRIETAVTGLDDIVDNATRDMISGLHRSN